MIYIAFEKWWQIIAEEFSIYLGLHYILTRNKWNGGELKNMDELIKDAIGNPMLTGITFSGGDPLEQAENFAYMAKAFKKAGLNIWCYTGYTFEQILNMIKENKALKELIDNIDVLVDGKFEINNKKDSLRFKGSTNQRLINVKESLDKNKIITIE